MTLYTGKEASGFLGFLDVKREDIRIHIGGRIGKDMSRRFRPDQLCVHHCGLLRIATEFLDKPDFC